MGYYLIFLVLVHIVLIVILTLPIILTIVIKYRQKASPYECGFIPKFHARNPLSLRFFLLAVIFIIFDIELILVLGSPLNPQTTSISVLLFIVLITIGFVHEWNEGALKWI